MSIDFVTLAGLVDLTNPSTKAVVDVISPYLPALQRVGKSGIDMFVESAQSQDWARIDRELYAVMTEDERDALGDAVLKSAREAVKHAYDRDQEFRNEMFRVLLGIVLTFI